MKIRQKLQKGVMMIEVVAVLGLIAAITPMLFQQISRRNDEILNVQVATEMRAVKEALAAYIQTNESTIAETCKDEDKDVYMFVNGVYQPINKDDPPTCIIFVNDDNPGTGERSFSELEPYFSGSSSVLRDYSIIVLGYTVPASDNTYRPFIYGIVAQTPIEDSNGIHAQQGLKNASKIASLIGLDGGVAVQADGDSKIMLHGIQGSWVLDNFHADDAPENTVVAITAFDTQASSAILKDVKLDHFKGISMQTDQAVADRISLREVLSVGDDNCIEHLGNTNVGVKKKGETAADKSTACVPLFEVDKDTGKITARNGIIETDIMYYVRKEEANGGSSGSNARYKLDLSGTSLMHDIYLTALGGSPATTTGAKLSELIPEWLLKDVEDADCSGSGSSRKVAITSWTCPTDYNRAVLFIPSSFSVESASGSAAHTHSVDISDNGSLHPDTVSGCSSGKLCFGCSEKITEVLVQKYCVKDKEHHNERVRIVCPINTYQKLDNDNKPVDGCKPCPVGATSNGGDATSCICPDGKTWNGINGTCS